MVKKAVLVGINYRSSQNSLNGCIADSQNIMNFLTQNCGYDPKNIQQLTDDTPKKPTRANMEASLIWLVSGAKAGDTLFFHFSGHGSSVRDQPNNSDETDGRDEVLVPLDFEKSSVITDDWLFTNVASKVPQGVTLLIFTDCCHSGTMIDLKYNYKSQCAVKTGKVIKDMPYVATNWTDNFSFNIERRNDVAGNVVLFSGCLDPQTSADAFIRGQGQGAFTYCLLQSVNSNMTRTADGKIKYNGNTKLRNLLKEVNARLAINAFDQRSQLSIGKQVDIENVFNP
jgi:hypothetical protein